MKPDRISENDSNLSTQGRRLRRCLGMLGAVFLVILLNGCASMATSENADSSQYNPNTGYPAVGSRPWHL